MFIMASSKNKEIEVRFLGIDAKKLKKKLLELGAKDHGSELLTATIFYDKKLTWREKNRFIRVREGKKNTITFKDFKNSSPTGTKEIETEVSDAKKIKIILEHIGLQLSRVQEKKRHKYTLGNMVFDFDSWPKIPTFLEIEAPSEAGLKKAVKLLGLSWKKAVSGNVGHMIEEKYHIPVPHLSFYTFKKIK